LRVEAKAVHMADGKTSSRGVGATRRAFLAGAAGVAAGAALGGLPGCSGDDGASTCRGVDAGAPAGGALVVEVLREDVIPTPSTPPVVERVQAMVDAALAELSGVAAPWSRLLPSYRAGQRIGLKVNCLNRYAATSVAVVQAIIGSLRRELAVPAKDILVWDRRLDELTACGFNEQALGVSVVGTVNSIQDPGGPGYTAPICGSVAGKTPRFSRILTELTDVTINCPVLKTHGVSGITGALKNIYGVIDNPGEYHDNLNTALPALYALPPIRSKMALAVLDALLAVVTGGTSDPADEVPKRVLVAQDGLALDAYALDLVNRLRAARKNPIAPVEPSILGWLKGSQDLGLGTLSYKVQTITQ
jgi:uncharacterized protein (DUF362 family)